MNNFNLKKYLAEGKLLKEEIDVASTITSIEDISDIRNVPTIRVNFNIDIPQDEDNDLKDKVDDYLYSEYPDAEDLDWRDSSEVEIHLNSPLTKDKLLNEFIGDELEKRNEVLYDKLVPGSGAAGTVEGEMLRAINRIIYRYYNDGDYYYKGYGTETAGPAHSFLINANHPQRSAMVKLFKEFVSDAEYEKMLNDILDVILDHIESRQGNYTENNEDLFDYKSEFQDEEEDDDYGYDNDYEDEGDYDN